MARFTLQRVIPAAPAAVFAVSMDPALHVRSMARHGEEMIEAPPGGVFTEGSTVTWRARHFGIPFRLRSVVFDIDSPRSFSDRQLRGPFRDFVHEHAFVDHPDGTLMRDVVTFHSPAGPLGRIVDAVFLRAYMRRLIDRRNDAIEAEFRESGRTLSE